MALYGELAGYNESVTCSCGVVMPLEVLHSGGGYYLGYFCPKCGPYSRESGYFRTEEEADKALNRFKVEGEAVNARSTVFVGNRI